MKPGRASDDVLVCHMLDCIDRVLEYTRNGRSEFFASRLIQDAVARNLQTLAESSQRLSESIKTKEPSIPWRDITYGSIPARESGGESLQRRAARSRSEKR